MRTHSHQASVKSANENQALKPSCSDTNNYCKKPCHPPLVTATCWLLCITPAVQSSHKCNLTGKLNWTYGRSVALDWHKAAMAQQCRWLNSFFLERRVKSWFPLREHSAPWLCLHKACWKAAESRLSNQLQTVCILKGSAKIWFSLMRVCSREDLISLVAPLPLSVGKWVWRKGKIQFRVRSFGDHHLPSCSMHRGPLRDAWCPSGTTELGWTHIRGLQMEYFSCMLSHIRGSGRHLPIGLPLQRKRLLSRMVARRMRSKTQLCMFFCSLIPRGLLGKNVSCSPASPGSFSPSPLSTGCLPLPSGTSWRGCFLLAMQNVPKDDPNTHISNRRYLLVTVHK